MNTGLTKKEYEIMKVLWNSDKPLASADIFAATKTVAENSIHPIIKKLLDNGYIKVVGSVRYVKAPSRLYVPAITLAEYVANRAKEIFRYNNQPLDIKSLLYCLTKKDKSSNNEYINAVEEFLNECHNSEIN